MTGTREAPRAEATFSVTNGSFREFQYQTFEGAIVYAADGVRLDTRLSQTPEAWIAAKGFVPAAFFKAPDPAAPAAPPADDHLAARPGEELDIAVTSSTLSLGLIEAFVPQVTKVSGTLQADVRVTGSPRDPHLNGSVDIRNGAFTIAELTKSGYTGFDTRITLTPDRVRIQEFSLVDEHQHTLSVSGELATHQRQIGGVQIAIKSDQFEIVDNQLADIKLNTDLRITGELRQPRVEGTLGVHTGTIRSRPGARVDHDQCVRRGADEARGGGTRSGAAGRCSRSSGHDAAPHRGSRGRCGDGAVRSWARYRPGRAGTCGRGQGGAGACPQRLRRAVPRCAALDADNVVIKGTDLNPSGASPVGLGDVNVTIGGDVRATKKPGDTVRLVGP